MYHYLVVIEEGETSYGAYVPDLPGCVAVGDTREEVERSIGEAILIHLNGMIHDHEPIPAAKSSATYLDIALPNQVA